MYMYMSLFGPQWTLLHILVKQSHLYTCTLQYNTIQYNNLFKVVTQGVVAHSPEPGAHDKSARQLKIQN